MYLTTTILLIIMIAVFVFSSIKFKSPEISMAFAGVVIAVIAWGLIEGLNNPVRYLVEGLFTNLDLAILFMTASLFINVYANSGSLDTVTRKLVSTFSNKWILMFFMAVFMIIPGALTGAGSVSVFVMGGLVATVITFMGLSDKKTAAFVFVFAIMSAAAPPINLWTMLMTASANMPYVGFGKLLSIPIIITGVFTIIYLGWGAKPQSTEKILEKLPQATEGMNLVRILLPLITIASLILLSLYLPWNIPVLGLPLMFIISTIVAILCNPKKTTFKEYRALVDNTMEQVFPLAATVISVGLLQSAMTATGVKGLIGVTFVTLPLVLIYGFILIIGPITQGSLSYGSAIIIGTPLIFMFNTHGFDTTVVCAALSLIFPIGDCLPPSRIVGRLTCEATGYKGSYMSFLKQLFLPCLLLGGIALVMLVNPNSFAFLK